MHINYTISASGHPDIMKNLSAPQCIGNPFHKVCIEFNVTMLATNGIEPPAQSMGSFMFNGCQGNWACDYASIILHPPPHMHTLIM